MFSDGWYRTENSARYNAGILATLAIGSVAWINILSGNYGLKSSASLQLCRREVSSADNVRHQSGRVCTGRFKFTVCNCNRLLRATLVAHQSVMCRNLHLLTNRSLVVRTSNQPIISYLPLSTSMTWIGSRRAPVRLCSMYQIQFAGGFACGL